MTMKRFRSTAGKPAAPTHALRRRLEILEDRTVPTAVAVPSGIVSWWTANTTAADAMGLNNATLSNVTYSAGEVGQAFSFNGLNGWAALGDPSSLAFTASFTIEGWIKVNGLPTNYNFGTIMFRGDDRGGLDPYTLVIEPNGDLHFDIQGSQFGYTSIEAPIPMGQFVHVAATLDDATGAMTLYENGAVVAQTVTPFRPFGPLDPTQEPGVGIGNSNALSTYDVPFNGLIDELSVYNRALTPSEVFGIYKAGSSGKVISPIAVNYPSVADGSGGATTPVTFTITRTGSLSGALTVNWTTADDSAIAGTDYTAASGTVTFADGQATQTVQVTTLDSNIPKANVDFKLIATPAGGTSIMGLATILNDSISVSDDTATEGGTSVRSLGAFIPAGLGGLTDATGITYGPNGNVYVSTCFGSAVYRYDAAGNPLPAPGQTGAVFIPHRSGGLSLARDIAFGPDGYLYVVSQATDAVLRYDPATGAPAGTLVASGAGGLQAPRGLLFRGGYVYVTSTGGTVGGPEIGASSVLRFDAVTGAPAGVSGTPGDAVFIPSWSGGLTNPSSIVFGPDGNAYVSSTWSPSSAVLRYNGTTGAFIDAFVPSGSGGLDSPWGMVFRPDGYLYVVGARSNSVLRYQASNGAFAGAVVPPGGGGASGPKDLLFDANGNLLVASAGTQQVLRYGATSQFAFTVSLAWPSAGTTTVHYVTADGTALAGHDYVAVSGTLTFPPGQTTQTVLVQTLDDHVSEPAETFFVNLSNPVGATIARGQGVGTVTDTYPPAVAGTRVNDGSAQRSRVTSLAVTFSTQVTFATTPGAAFTLTRTSDGAAVSFTATASVIGGQTVVTLDSFTGSAAEFGSLADGRYTLTALAGQITANGQALDGNGDGTPGDDYTFGAAQGLFRLFGDSDGNGVVDALDLFRLRTSFGKTSADPGFLAYFDFDGSGAVDALDLFRFRQRFGTALP
jgi:hypothetical protein